MPARTKHRSNSSVIETTGDIARGCKSLRRRCLHLRTIHDEIGDPPLRRREAGFKGLARIVVGQQLSIASADSIWKRLEEALQPFEPATILTLEDSELRNLGLSRPKIKTLRGIAHAVVTGDICFDELENMQEAELREALTALPGIGPWSADIYLMFCLGAKDAFAPGDLALQEAVRLVFGLPARPRPEEIEAIAERWKPWRGVAARLLWADYAHRKKRPKKKDS